MKQHLTPLEQVEKKDEKSSKIFYLYLTLEINCLSSILVLLMKIVVQEVHFAPNINENPHSYKWITRLFPIVWNWHFKWPRLLIYTLYLWKSIVVASFLEYLFSASFWWWNNFTACFSNFCLNIDKWLFVHLRHWVLAFISISNVWMFSGKSFKIL